MHQVHVVPAGPGQGIHVAAGRQAQMVGFTCFDELVHVLLCNHSPPL